VYQPAGVGTVPRLLGGGIRGTTNNAQLRANRNRPSMATATQPGEGKEPGACACGGSVCRAGAVGSGVVTVGVKSKTNAVRRTERRRTAAYRRTNRGEPAAYRRKGAVQAMGKSPRLVFVVGPQVGIRKRQVRRS